MKQFVNDGDKTRGDRENILNPNYGVMGVSHCEHNSQLKYMTDLLFVNSYSQN